MMNILLKRSLCMLATVIAAGCSSPSNENNNVTEQPEIKPAPSVDTVNIVKMKFSPADIAVHSGDTVIWINNDMVAHDITEQRNHSWSSSLLAPGKSWKMVITKDEDYYCSIHQVMTGKIILE
jgi:plastocyanin